MTPATKRLAENATIENGAAVKITKGHTKSPVVDTRVPINEEQRHHLICEAAYYRAERRGFPGGDPAEDWAEAEAEIDRMHFGESQETSSQSIRSSNPPPLVRVIPTNVQPGIK